jgi:hypothetical protein
VVNCVYNISEVASLSDSAANRYITIRRFLDSISINNNNGDLVQHDDIFSCVKFMTWRHRYYRLVRGEYDGIQTSHLQKSVLKVPIHVRVRLGSGSNEPNSFVCWAPRARLGRVRLGAPGPSVGFGSPPARYWLARVWLVPSQSRISTRPHAQTL